MERIQKTVIVVGSGISGLSCAYELLKNGFTVQILEARHIHGGRISKNSTFADFPIETGAEEIHLPTKYYKIAKEVGAKCESDSDFNSYIEDLPKKGEDLSMGSGILIDEEDFYDKYKIEKFYKSILKEEEKKFLKDDMSILEYFKFKQIDDRLIQFYETVLANEYGSTLQEMSIKGYAEHELNWEYEEKRYVITNMSHFDVVDRAFSTVLPFVKYNTPINYIAIQTNQLQNQSNGVTLVDAYGNEYKADHVVVTVPVSQLKNGSINFVPPLSQEKQRAIQLLQMGKGGKLHMKFKEKFWPSDYYAVVLRTQIGLVWNCSYHRSKKSLVLCALISGQASIDMNDPNKRKQLMSELFVKLQQVFKLKKNVEELLEDYIWTDFNTMKYIEGTYTYPSLNLGLFRNILAQPVNNQIFFAGEATEPLYYATINGALDSGVREAQKIISLYKK
ncbi:flavin containing family amine oxidase (macronuclear) [Tetrahymena thermophila SB210]|uniref:Flavin containing family amine oxidase n=1 Tax=Tetrahymena thermophila (strain SB210) TaxID=312017 RepID=Q23MA6_TETTS|nr:flavin containing family amine oxidase [Tetrahymena thermophila SB210]EAR97733.1 flavin containing family amine oxidase [Tetrahymena thermophila SB210]|eukprot:XP_001017978.1 flavin containing family amine oxidase [Tetrahymena thermophila SB210]